MNGTTEITMCGNVVNDVELRFTPSGAAVANFRIASTPRKFNKQTNEWEDGDPLFLGVAAWRQLGENVAESIRKGMRVVVVGRLTQRQYDDKDGNRRSSYDIQADEVAPSLRNATAQVTKTTGRQGAQQQGGGGWGAQQTQQQPQGDPWASGQQAGGWGAQGSPEPPF